MQRHCILSPPSPHTPLRTPAISTTFMHDTQLRYTFPFPRLPVKLLCKSCNRDSRSSALDYFFFFFYRGPRNQKHSREGRGKRMARCAVFTIVPHEVRVRAFNCALSRFSLFRDRRGTVYGHFLRSRFVYHANDKSQ